MTFLIEDFSTIRRAARSLNDEAEAAVDGGGALATPDGQILSLFKQWAAALRYAESIAAGDEEEFSAACRIAWRLEERIFQAPAEGVRGLALKVFLAHRSVYGSSRGVDPCMLNATEDGFDDRVDDFFRSAIRDAATFVPELAPLCAPAIGST